MLTAVETRPGLQDIETAPALSLRPTGTAGLVSIHSLAIKTLQTERGYVPKAINAGAYAVIYEAEERVDLDQRPADTIRLARPLVFKVFKDNAPPDWAKVYSDELESLLKIGPHERIVELLGAHKRLPPTFVCGGCGQAFHVERCPRCGNELLDGDSSGLILTCGEHQFHRDNLAQVRSLTAMRPCRHSDDCSPINFLPRPYLLLERLDVDLRTFQDFLSRAAGSAPAIALESADEPQRQREVLLLKLEALVGVAEGLAHCHARGQVHLDIAPDNVMLRLAAPRPGGRSGFQGVKLIDPGRARALEAPQSSASALGRLEFLAPEQIICGRTKVSARVSRAFVADHCIFAAHHGQSLSLEPRDHVWDDDGGQYTIVDGAALDADVRAGLPPDLVDAGGQLLGHVRCARVIRAPTNPSPQPTSLVFIQSQSFAADIFSFGCLVAWSITGGHDDVLQKIRSRAAVVLDQPASHRFAPKAYLAGDYEKIAQVIELPADARDDAIRAELLSVVLRCLVRAEGAYCPRRSAGLEAAAAVCNDLKRVHAKLLMLYRAEGKLSAWHEQLVGSKLVDLTRTKAALERREAELVDEKTRVEHLLREVSDERTRLTEDNSRLEKRIGRLTEESSLLERRIAQLVQHNKQLASEKENLGQTSSRLADASRRLEGLRDQLSSEKEALAQRVDQLAQDQQGLTRRARRLGGFNLTLTLVSLALALVLVRIAATTVPREHERRPEPPQEIAAVTETKRPRPAEPVRSAEPAPPPDKGVPLVADQDLGAAIKRLNERGLRPVVVKGTGDWVSEQEPRPETPYKPGDRVNLTLTKSPGGQSSKERPR